MSSGGTTTPYGQKEQIGQPQVFTPLPDWHNQAAAANGVFSDLLSDVRSALVNWS